MGKGGLDRRHFFGLGGAAAASIPAVGLLTPTASAAPQARTGSSRVRSFGGKISKSALEYYVSRVLTFQGIAAGMPEPTSDTFDDDLRVVLKTGARIVGHAAYFWYTPESADVWNAHFALAKQRAGLIHAAEPDLMLEAMLFEIVTPDVNNIPIPAWVFTEFGATPQNRNFNYNAMLYPDGTFVGSTQSYPDIRQLETQMWYYLRSVSYIDAGFEVLHYGAVEVIIAEDTDFAALDGLLARVRRYALIHARRNLILATGHTHGLVRQDGRLVLDFHAYPVRPDEILTGPDHGSSQPAELRLGKDQTMGDLNAIYGESAGGKTPSGWSTPSLTYSVDFDDYGGAAPPAGTPDLTSIWTWGYDEIAWFALQPADYRNYWLPYAFNWIRQNDPVGWLAMPGRRTLAPETVTFATPLAIGDGSIDHVTANEYKINNQSASSPIGFSQEDIATSIWAAAGATP